MILLSMWNCALVHVPCTDVNGKVVTCAYRIVTHFSWEKLLVKVFNSSRCWLHVMSPKLGQLKCMIGWHLHAQPSAGRGSRHPHHAAVNDVIHRSLDSANIPPQ